MSYKETEKAFRKEFASDIKGQDDNGDCYDLFSPGEKLKDILAFFRLSHLKELEARAERLKGKMKETYETNADLRYDVEKIGYDKALQYDNEAVGYNAALQEELSLVERAILEIKS